MSGIFVGLYAVGFTENQPIIFEKKEGVFLTELCNKGTPPSVDVVSLPYPMLKAMTPGIYVGIATFSNTFEVKVLRLNVVDQALLMQSIPEEYHQECEAAIEKIFGLGDEEGPTKEYVDQDHA